MKKDGTKMYRKRMTKIRETISNEMKNKKIREREKANGRRGKKKKNKKAHKREKK